MDCYSLGVSRLMGVIVEKFHDDRGIIWPGVIAPARVHLVTLGSDDEVYREATGLYAALQQQGVPVP